MRIKGYARSRREPLWQTKPIYTKERCLRDRGMGSRGRMFLCLERWILKGKENIYYYYFLCGFKQSLQKKERKNIVLYVQEVLTHFIIVSNYIKWVKTSWTYSMSTEKEMLLLMWIQTGVCPRCYPKTMPRGPKGSGLRDKKMWLAQ